MRCQSDDTGAQVAAPRSSIFVARGIMLLSAALPSAARAHGTLENGRMLQVRLAGPNGNSPAPWNESYYTWHLNSQKFPGYAQRAFAYAHFVPDGKIASAGIHDGVQTDLDFSGLNQPSAAWRAAPAAAGESKRLTFLATAPRDPSYFEVYLTKQGFEVATQVMGWGDLEYLGRWAVNDAARPVTIGTKTNPITGGPMPGYDWHIGIPSDRSGHHALVVIWQRIESAGEAVFARAVLALKQARTGVDLALSFHRRRR